jgi:hypothetical protein
VPLVPAASVEEVIANWFDVIVMDVAADFVCTGLLLSVTVTVKLNVPPAVGVPEITPLAPARTNPAGRLPELTDQV